MADKKKTSKPKMPLVLVSQALGGSQPLEKAFIEKAFIAPFESEPQLSEFQQAQALNVRTVDAQIFLNWAGLEAQIGNVVEARRLFRQAVDIEWVHSQNMSV
jgi:hypothetical protein